MAKVPLHNYVIVTKSFGFAMLILNFPQQLQDKQFTLAIQPQRSGTSIGANIREAQNVECETDFNYHNVLIINKQIHNNLIN